MKACLPGTVSTGIKTFNCVLQPIEVSWETGQITMYLSNFLSFEDVRGGGRNDPETFL